MSTEVTIPASAATFIDSATANRAKVYYTAGQTWEYIGGDRWSFFRMPLPADLADQDIAEAYVTVTAEAGTGDRTMTLRQHGDPPAWYSKTSYNNRPLPMSGATVHSVTQDSADTEWVFDVKSDLELVQGGAKFYGWLLNSTHPTNWRIKGWKTTTPPTLTVVYADVTQTPTGLGPDGITALAAPVLTWVTPDDMTSGRVQLATAPVDPDDPADFTTPLFDSGNEPTTVAQLDLDALGYSGIPTNGGKVVARVRHETPAGFSDWSDAITITRQDRGALVISSPTGTTHDPTPATVWSMPDQIAWQAIYKLGGKVIHDTGEVPGADAAFTPDVGATKSGQALSIEVRGWDSYRADRTTSPGDFGYSSDTITTVYTPGPSGAVQDITAAPDLVKPWIVNVAWEPPLSGSPAFYRIIRGDVILAKIDATDEGGDVLTYADQTAPPNTNVTYTVLAVDDDGIDGAAGTPAAVRTRITGLWLFEPVEDGPRMWLKVGDDFAPTYAESTVWYAPVGGTHEIKRTFAMRGQSADPVGRLQEYGPDNRSTEEQMADVWAIKSRPAAQLRAVWGDQNVPVIASDVDPQMFNPLSTHQRIVKQVRFHFKQNGELPFTPVAP